jgi:hypothetical protein
MKANHLVEQLTFNYCFLFGRNFISESLLVVGQKPITKRQAFCFDVNHYFKN